MGNGRRSYWPVNSSSCFNVSIWSIWICLDLLAPVLFQQCFNNVSTVPRLKKIWHHMTSCWGADVLWWPSSVIWDAGNWKVARNKGTLSMLNHPGSSPSSKLWAQFALLSKHIPAPISRAMAAMRWTSLVFLPVSWACSYVELPWQANSTVRPSYLIARTMELSNLYGTTEYSIEAVPRGDSENGAYKQRGFVEDLLGSLQVLWNMKKLRPWDLVVLPYYPHSQSRLISGNIRYGE